MKGWKKIFHANRDQKKAGVAVLLSDKIDFKTKAVKRDKDGHYITIKGSIQEVQFSSVAQSCPTLCDPTDGSPPGPAIPGILQARTLEWVATAFSIV